MSVKAGYHVAAAVIVRLGSISVWEKVGDDRDAVRVVHIEYGGDAFALKRPTVYRIVRLVENDYRLFELFRKRFDLLDGKPVLMVVSLFWGDCIPEVPLRMSDRQE